LGASFTALSGTLLPSARAVPLGGMRGLLLLWLCPLAIWLGAQEVIPYRPIFTDPTALRALQLAHDTTVPRLGPFGLPQPAAARFGWERVQSDSLFAFEAARTLWMDYFCLFGDSVCADWALIGSPRAVRDRSLPTVRWNDLPRTSARSLSRRPVPVAFQSRSFVVPTVAHAAEGARPADPSLLASPKPEVPTAPVKPSELRIVVRSGDNFGVLQRRHPGVTLKELYAANKGSDRIYPGQVLKIPR